MKLLVHCAPAVTVCTPGRIVADAAGAHEGTAVLVLAPKLNAPASARLVTAVVDTMSLVILRTDPPGRESRTADCARGSRDRKPFPPAFERTLSRIQPEARAMTGRASAVTNLRPGSSCGSS